MGGAFKNPPNADASPREYSRHQRYASIGRLRYSQQKKEWISVQATRLSATEEEIYNALQFNTADQIEAAESYDALATGTTTYNQSQVDDVVTS